jgi:hypothetical protein
MNWIRWIIATAIAILIKFAIEDPIENALLDAFRTSLKTVPYVSGFLEIVKFILAVSVAIWVYRRIASHPS